MLYYISVWLGVHYDAKKYGLKGTPREELPKFKDLFIEKGHLATNISHLGMISYKLGRSINWDGANEKIINDAAATALLKREYRGDWEYPNE